MPLVTRQYGPNAKNTKLSNFDMDSNLYYLQELGVSGFSYSNGIIEISNPTGGTKSVTINKVTGFTYNNLNTFTITDNYNNNFSATINTVTGLTVNGTISATTYQNLPPATFNGGSVTGSTTFTNGLTANTISATTYLNLPINPDVFVTGGTYSNGDTTFTNNTGGTFNVSGFYTGETSYVNSLTTGVGLSADTTNGDITIINTDPDQTVVLNNGTNINVTGTYPNFTIDVTGLTDFNTFTTGFTYQDNTFTILDNSGNTFDATFTDVTGLTVNGDLNITGTTYSNVISATTYQNLPIDPDTYVTGFTYGGNVFTVKQNNGQPDLTSTINSVTGWTVNGVLTVTGDTSVEKLTANTVKVLDTSGTPDQAASFNSGGRLVAGLGQTTYSTFGTSALGISNATTTFTVVPGLTQTLTVPTNCSVYVVTTGGIGNTNGTNYSFTADFAIFVDGVGLTQGGYGRVNTFNPATTNAAFTNTTWSISTILNLSAGSHTIDLRVVYRNTSNAAQGASVSSVPGNVRQGELYVIIIKN